MCFYHQKPIVDIRSHVQTTFLCDIAELFDTDFKDYEKDLNKGKKLFDLHTLKVLLVVILHIQGL